LDNLKTGELNTKELILLFGTPKLQERYIKEKKLGGKDKQALLIKIKRYCDIEDLGQGNFVIHKIYTIKNENCLIPLYKGLSKYLTPLILIKLLEEQDQNYKITLPFLGWAKNFEMINDNYPLLKYHQKAGSKYLKINENIMFEYFEKMDECIKYYLDKILTIFADKKGLDLIDFDSITMVRKLYLNQNVDTNNIDIKGNWFDEIISDEDRKFVIDCENKAKDKAKIMNNQEKFYGPKSHIYKNELRKLLNERNIIFTYSAYNIFCKNKDEIKNIIEQFTSILSCKTNDLVQTFNETFIDYIENKATNRQNREQNKLDDDKNKNIIKKYRLTESYVSNFKALSELTVKRDAKDLKNELDLNNLEDILSEYSTYNLSINIDKLKKL